MITLLAQHAAQSNSDRWWLTLAVPTGVIIGALIAGGFNKWTAKKPPHEKLEKLIAILKDWPEDLAGKETVHQAVELTLGEIRSTDRLEDIPDPVAPDAAPSEIAEAEATVDDVVRERERVRRNESLKSSWTSLAFALAAVWFFLQWSKAGIQSLPSFMAFVLVSLGMSAFVWILAPLLGAAWDETRAAGADAVARWRRRGRVEK
ncbi:hypothetical protein OG225_40570 (plasmid) [Nocardia sp. NBC_01377]|uniref:hypothetical protein n=1 Tax=Nocardia sp. NBC_01377 TaxID=2903595 RepID=UPI002F90750C